MDRVLSSRVLRAFLPQLRSGACFAPHVVGARAFAGHNKWSKIRHKKGAEDQKRGALFSKLSIEISAAAKACGGDETSVRLQNAVARARTYNMPVGNIDRAIDKGVHGKGDAQREEYVLEGRGPGGTAVIVRCLTDNKKRTAPAVRSYFSRHDGELGVSGSVGYLFERKGVVGVALSAGADGGEDEVEELVEELMGAVLDVAEDVETDPDPDGAEGTLLCTVVCEPSGLAACREAVSAAGHTPKLAELQYVPTQMQSVGAETMARLEDMLGVMDEDGDIVEVFHNAEIAEE
eukprot:g4377.t1